MMIIPTKDALIFILIVVSAEYDRRGSDRDRDQEYSMDKSRDSRGGSVFGDYWEDSWGERRTWKDSMDERGRFDTKKEDTKRYNQHGKWQKHHHEPKCAYCDNTPEAEIMSQFYYQTDGWEWAGEDSHWLDCDCPVCEWDEGIECEFGHIVALNFENRDLGGQLPWFLHLLHHIHSVNLSNNHILSPLPDEICDLIQKVDYLDLGNNDLTGDIPECLCSIHPSPDKCHPSVVRLNGNDLKSFPDCECETPFLSELDVSCNRIKEIPESFAQAGIRNGGSVDIFKSYNNELECPCSLRDDEN
ncbi:hypothetical protein ADUPG1_008460, partial [Aduncisulcus paluster]